MAVFEAARFSARGIGNFRISGGAEDQKFWQKNDFFEDFNSNLTEDLVLEVFEAAQSNERII